MGQAAAKPTGSASAGQIVVENGKGGFALRLDTLRGILLADDVKHKPVVVISVTGASGKGKSLILDMMLRYLRSHDWISARNDTNFMIATDGTPTATTGIIMWSHLFPVALPNGEEAVIVLMDTQGASAGKQDAPQAQAVQTLATLLSSLQIVNVMDDLSDDALEQLRQSIELGQRLSEGTSATAFQKLMFLVRDWTETDKFPLGAKGGDRLVTKWLHNKTASKQLETARSHIGDCFSDVNGFLLPYPGTPTLFPPEFHKSSSSDMNPDFVTGLKDLVKEVLAPENLAIKAIAGNHLTASDLYTFISSYVDLFSSDKPPEPEEVVRATMEAILKTAVERATLKYHEEVGHLINKYQPAVSQDELVRKHKEAAAKADKVFDARTMVGDDSLIEKHRDALAKEMGKRFALTQRVSTEKRTTQEQMVEKKKKEESEKYVTELVHLCTEGYISAMQTVVEYPGCVTEEDLKRAHSTAKDKAMVKYDVKSKSHTVGWDSRFKLASIIGVRYRLIRHHNGLKNDVEGQCTARGNMKALKMGLKMYRTFMSRAISGDEIDGDKVLRLHEEARKAAVDTFKAFQQGKDETIKVYLGALNEIIDNELEMIKYRLAN